MTTTFERVKAILVDQLGNEAEDKIVPTARMSDLSADSLDVVELELECEEAFRFRFNDRVATAAGFGEDPTIAEVVATVDRLVAEGVEPFAL